MAKLKDIVDTKSLSNEDLQRHILEVEYQTKLHLLGQAEAANLNYSETEADRQRKRDQVQFNAKQAAINQDARERACKHHQGVGPDDVNGPGSGKSCLTLSRIFFAWNWLIQCVWCGMKNQTPHPGRKNRKLLEGETAADRDARVKLYQKDLERHKELFEQARANKLPPMLGPSWSFTDEDGVEVVPAIR